MSRQPQQAIRAAVCTLVLCGCPRSVMADYAIDWHTVDGGR